MRQSIPGTAWDYAASIPGAKAVQAGYDFTWIVYTPDGGWSEWIHGGRTHRSLYTPGETGWALRDPDRGWLTQFPHDDSYKAIYGESPSWAWATREEAVRGLARCSGCEAVEVPVYWTRWGNPLTFYMHPFADLSVRGENVARVRQMADGWSGSLDLLRRLRSLHPYVKSSNPCWGVIKSLTEELLCWMVPSRPLPVRSDAEILAEHESVAKVLLA